MPREKVKLSIIITLSISSSGITISFLKFGSLISLLVALKINLDRDDNSLTF